MIRELFRKKRTSGIHRFPRVKPLKPDSSVLTLEIQAILNPAHCAEFYTELCHSCGLSPRGPYKMYRLNKSIGGCPLISSFTSLKYACTRCLYPLPINWRLRYKHRDFINASAFDRRGNKKWEFFYILTHLQISPNLFRAKSSYVCFLAIPAICSEMDGLFFPMR